MSNLSAAMKNFCQLEQMAEGHTVIHRLHPLAKLTMTLTYVLVVVSFPAHTLSAMVPMILYPVLGMALSETPWSPLLRRMLLAAPFAVVMGLSNLLLDRNIRFFLAGIPMTGGLVSCLSILLKTALTVSAVLLLIATTPLTELTGQLARIHVPRVLCLQFILTYRYISVLLHEAEQMYTAYRLRAGNIRGIRMADVGFFLGQLLLRSYDRADRVYCAMKCRGYDGGYHAGAAKRQAPRDIWLSLTVCAALLLVRMVNVSVLLGSLL